MFLLCEICTIWSNYCSLKQKSGRLIVNPLKIKFVNSSSKVGRSQGHKIEIPKHWQQLKVYDMLLERYLRKRKMKLLKREVKPAIRIQLKTISYWLISKSHLRKE